MKIVMKCPCCESTNLVKNGFSQSRKQNRICKDCRRQFLENSQDHFITEQEKSLIRRLLLERLSYAAICRVAKVSYNWLLRFAEKEYGKAPENLNIVLHKSNEFSKELKLEICEGDELWRVLLQIIRSHETLGCYFSSRFPLGSIIQRGS